MLIGISGQAGSGKDTCADFLVKEYDFAKVAFADPLKRICKDVFDFSDIQLWGASEFRNTEDTRYPRSIDSQTNGYLTPRYALQTLGSEWGRDCYGDIWVDYALRIAKTINEAYTKEEPIYYDAILGLVETYDNPSSEPCHHQGVVISDVRFLNEINKIKKNGGILIRVVRPSAGLKGTAGMHRSEQEMNDIPDSEFDHIIINNSGLDDLKTEILKIADSYR